MSRELDSILDRGNTAIKRGTAYLLENLGKAVALITALVACLVIFTEISFQGFSAKSLTTTLIAMLISSYVIFFSLCDAGERSGKESEEYVEACKKLKEARDKISGESIGSFRTFIEDYTKAELRHRRRIYLLGYGLNEQGYEAFINTGDGSRSERKVYKRASKMRPARLTPTMLLSTERVGAEELECPERFKALRQLLKLLPTTVCTLLTVSMALSLRDGLTAENIIEGILRLSTLPVVAFRGYACGWSYAKGPLTAWQRAKTDILLAYLSREGAKSESI